MKGGIKAIIPVRSGSTRVGNKNLRAFAGSSLLEIKVRQLMKVKGLDGVVVSSNDPVMQELARSLGAEVHIRDQYFASDTVPMSEVYRNMVSEMDCDHVLYATVTTPLVKSESYEQALLAYAGSKGEFDSVASVADVKEFLVKDGVPLNYDPLNFPRSQDLPDISRLTFAISILPRELMMSKMSSLGHKPLFLRLSQEESIDIDTPLDFEIAEWLYTRTSN